MVGAFKDNTGRSKAVYIDLPVQRVECTRCQAVRQVKIQFSKWAQALYTFFRKVGFGSLGT
ncbi:MAG: hypothetical protein IPH22_13865 [Nitrosomonas sp.]|nr:hypothetical protein [Nitrosomonas sp.]